MPDCEPEYRILIVEDDPHTLELLSYNLSEAGYHVTTAEDGLEALEQFRTEPFDLILCDIMLPRMNGFELREAILEDPSLRDIAFIFLTAKSSSEDQIHGLQSGVDEYITKPFDLDVLLARVQAVLARRETFARIASIDPLTELLNRQAVERAIKRELRRIRRYPAVAALVFLDIDGFKRVNDEYGHVVGDQVLVQLADIFNSQSRAVDVVGRLGGEEFILFFPQTPEYEALSVVERMQQHFQQPMEAMPGARMSFSAGIVETPRDGSDFETLYTRADAAMYQAKRNGKARVTAWRPGMEASSSEPGPA